MMSSSPSSSSSSSFQFQFQSLLVRRWTIVLALIGTIVEGFAPVSSSSGHKKNAVKRARNVATSSGSTTSSSSSLLVVLDPDLILEARAARAAFGLCFFGAAGSAASGRVILPQMIDQWKTYQNLVGKGGAPSKSGEELELFGYAEIVYADDVTKVLSNPLPPAEMATRFPPVQKTRETNLNFESMSRANEKVSQTAVRAVFDSMANGINKNQIYIPDVEEKLDEYRLDMGVLVRDNNRGKALGIGALVVLVSLLGLADYFAVYHLLKGWFPGWEGFVDFPTSLFDDRGLSALPDFFVFDLPV